MYGFAGKEQNCANFAPYMREFCVTNKNVDIEKEKKDITVPKNS